jgi:hypothetical protein
MEQRLVTKSAILSAPRARLAAVFAGALTLGASATASASPSYPAVVQDFFAIGEADDAPTCKLCHATDDGGPGRLNNFVGMYVRYDLGVEGGISKEDLRDALFRWGMRHDADADGVTDIEEMKSGANPNVLGEEPEEEKTEETSEEENGGAGTTSGEPKDEGRYRVKPGQKMGGCSYADVATEGGARDAAFLALAVLARRLFTKRRPKRAAGSLAAR